MAIAFVADRATANSNSAVTTVDLALSSLTVGNLLIIRTAADNSGGGGAARTVTVTNQSGSAIDTGTLQQWQQNNDPGAASAGVTCNVVVATITATSGTVRLTYSGSVVQACVAEEWSGINTGTPIVGTPSGANGTSSTTMASVGDASVASGNLCYCVEAIEGPSTDVYNQDTDTSNGSWSTLTKVGTTNVTADTNMTTYGGYKVVTGTGGQTYTPTITVTARDTAGLILEIAAVTEVTATLSAPLGGLTATAAAAPERSATLDAVLGALAATAAATVEHPATLAAPLGSLTGTAVATVEHPATLAASLGALASTAAAGVEHPANATTDLGALTASTTAAVEHPAALAAPLGALTAAATATVDSSGGSTVEATLTAPLGELTAAATVTVDHTVVLAAALGVLVAVAVATSEPVQPDPWPDRYGLDERRTSTARESSTTTVRQRHSATVRER